MEECCGHKCVQLALLVDNLPDNNGLQSYMAAHNNRLIPSLDYMSYQINLRRLEGAHLSYLLRRPMVVRVNPHLEPIPRVDLQLTRRAFGERVAEARWDVRALIAVELLLLFQALPDDAECYEC